MRRSDGRFGLAARKGAMCAAAAVVTLTLVLAHTRSVEGAPQVTLSQPTTKGIWEPVNYKGDMQFEDVYFVTADVGWVAGVSDRGTGGGVILHTRDGGNTWDVQFGDPESNDRPIRELFFLDERHGWATRSTGSGDHLLLRTTDGEVWEEAGTIAQHRAAYLFISPTVGFVATGPEVRMTQNGGRRWTTAGSCAVRIEVEGLTRDATCHLRAIHFPSRAVGYAVGEGEGDFFYVMKTSDGGRSWSSSAIPAVGGAYAVVFIDERRGFVRTRSGKMYRTDDGGDSWRPIPAIAPKEIKFADPEVGWSMNYRAMLYTTNGGRSWVGREIPFPAGVNAFSIPRRDRGYAVGDHGMIYRYRVVRASEQVARSIPGPTMPAFETELDDKVATLDAFVESLEQSVAKMPDDAGQAAGSAGAAGSSAQPESSQSSSAAEAEATESTRAATSETSETPRAAESEIPGSGSVKSGASAAAPMSAFIQRCCGKSISRWYLGLAAAEALLPEFVAKFKNTNLLAAGIRMLTVLPARVRAADAAFRDFKRSQNKDEAKANVTRLSAAVDALRTSVAISLQKELPPPGEAPAATGASVVGEPTAPAQAAADRDDANTSARKKTSAGKRGDDGKADGAKDATKEELKKAIRRRIRFP